MAEEDFTIPQFIEVPSSGPSFDRWDWLQLGALFLLWFCLLPLRYDSLPLQLWDESHLANSAVEMARSGHWLVPSYDGIPDHWSVKPPLLIWQMAALMWLGLSPLLAVRLPTMLAALATVGTVWAVCRYGLRDRVAAALAGFLLLSSLYYTKIHIARTGDYDVPLSFFTLLYVLAFWHSLERRDRVSISWFAFSAAALFFAVMTKGVAGTLGLVGLFVFSLTRGKFGKLVGNSRIWLLSLLAVGLCLGYYGSRELYDPGYLEAVWQNELVDRFFSVNEGHAERRLFYFVVLGRSFEPCMILLPLAALTVLGIDSRRRSLVTLCLFCAAAILAVLTTSQTKIYWYVASVPPFLAIAAAVGVSDGLRLIKTHELRVPKPFRTRPLQVVVGVLLAIASAASIYRNQVMQMQISEQSWYGALFDELQSRGYSSVLVLDTEFPALPDNPPLKFYVKFYAASARNKGLRPEVTREIPATLPKDELIATCDPKLTPWLKNGDGFAIVDQVHSCIFGIAHRLANP